MPWNMTELIFRDWKFLIDRDATGAAYSSVRIGGTESCQCPECKNYLAFRDRVFPENVKELFIDTGIDYKKEVEITYWEKLENNSYHIGGWFHFIGKILEGPRCYTPLPSGNGTVLTLQKIGENFSVGFDERGSLNFFNGQDDLIQLEFSTHIPWVLDEEPQR